MKQLYQISLAITGLFAILNVFFGISFSVDIVDKALLTTFGILGIISLILIFPKTWMRLVIGGVMIVFAITVWFMWEIIGYEARIDRTWDFDNHNVQLQHRLEIAGPGSYWFIVNRELLGGVMEMRIETRQYQAGLHNPPKKFEFITSDGTLELNCCENKIIVLPDSMTYQEKLEHVRQMKNEKKPAHNDK